MIVILLLQVISNVIRVNDGTSMYLMIEYSNITLGQELKKR